jgi:hypothetical protein
MLQERDGHWEIFHSTTHNIRFVPASWLEWLPPFCAKPKDDPKSWLVWILDLWEHKCRIRIFVRECNDSALRQKVIKRLTQDPKEFGFKTTKLANDTQATLRSENIYQWPQGQEPDKTELLKKISAQLTKLEGQLSGVGNALKPILSNPL